MKVLIIGGTIFLGRHLVQEAQRDGHQVTLFHRGRHTIPELKDLETIHGDRDGELHHLGDRKWDVVVDTCGYVPRVVRASAEYLAGRCEHYIFVSSVSVYSDPTKAGIDESSPVGRLTDESTEEVTDETYGPLKVLCEKAAEESMAGRFLSVRAGLVAGPHDPTDRFTYWPRRIAQGGEILVPGEPAAPVQFIDARDLARWILHAAENRLTGPYNITGPDANPVTFETLVETCRAAAGSDAHFTWVGERFLLDHDVKPWTDIPLWLAGPETVGMNQIDCTKAIRDGLNFRSLLFTVQDTLKWDRKRDLSDDRLKAGMSRERQDELLELWRRKASGG